MALRALIGKLGVLPERAAASRALIGKLRVLPERAGASRAFSSQLENQCPKCSREVKAGSYSEMLKETERRNMEKIARMKRNSTVIIVLGTAGTSALLFYTACVIEAIFDDDV